MSEEKGRKSPAVIAAVLLLLLILVVALFMALRSPGEPEETPTLPPETVSPAPTEPPLPPETASPPPTETAEPTPSPTPTHTPVYTPPPETDEPSPLQTDEPTVPPTIEPTVEPTDEPTPPPTDIPGTTSGSFRSNTGTGLELVVDWVAVPSGNRAADVEFTLSAQSYSLSCDTMINGGVVTIDGESYVFETAAVSYEGTDLAKNTLGSVTIRVMLPEDEEYNTPATATWDFQGSYGGEQLDKITAAGYITI